MTWLSDSELAEKVALAELLVDLGVSWSKQSSIQAAGTHFLGKSRGEAPPPRARVRHTGMALAPCHLPGGGMPPACLIPQGRCLTETRESLAGSRAVVTSCESSNLAPAWPLDPQGPKGLAPAELASPGLFHRRDIQKPSLE